MLEIERKFLVHSAKLPRLDKPQIIRQAYLISNEGRSLRIRQLDDEYILSVKIDAGGITRHEFEITVSQDMGAELFAAPVIGDVIQKRRYLITHSGHQWELDVFDGHLDGLNIAEIELRGEDESFEKPNWVGDEVTFDERYGNSMMARYGKPCTSESAK